RRAGELALRLAHAQERSDDVEAQRAKLGARAAELDARAAELERRGAELVLRVAQSEQEGEGE
ncbi:MAG: hypothetical protein QOD76_861, partial [Solirubrobacteraceae bacterium]|nr:hypothetical protein [Solirubrobacteraceae bacterium]